MEIPFPAIHLYVVLALAATLASVVATHLRSPNHMSAKSASWMAVATCVLLVVAWGHLLIVLTIFAWRARYEDQVVWPHLVTHVSIIALMLPIVCATVANSWKTGVKNSGVW